MASANSQPQPQSQEPLAKARALEQQLRAAGRVLVAFSGGVDSSYLAFAAHTALGADALAVTAVSPSYPARHRRVAEQVVAQFGLAHRFVETHEMESASYRANRPDRCYFCKSELFARLAQLREELGFDAIAYGVNTDDTDDFRPGHRAADERGVLSPFLDVGLSKAEIRALSRRAGLPTAELPASACLASRLPYGTEVTPERLAQVDAGERALGELGFRQTRLRHHGPVARIEIAPAELPRALDPSMARAIVNAVKPLGFQYVALDLEGYRSGALNEGLLQIKNNNTAPASSAAPAGVASTRAKAAAPASPAPRAEVADALAPSTTRSEVTGARAKAAAPASPTTRAEVAGTRASADIVALQTPRSGVSAARADVAASDSLATRDEIMGARAEAGASPASRADVCVAPATPTSPASVASTARAGVSQRGNAPAAPTNVVKR